MNIGAIKKIDELGRVVIPKDIRKSLSIRSNDSLEIKMVGNSISIEKNISVKSYDEVARNIATLFSKCNIKLLVTNRNAIIFNNTSIDNLNISSLIDLSLIELIEKKKDISINSDIRPIIIDSNVEGIVIVEDSCCNEKIGELFNILVTTKLDISC